MDDCQDTSEVNFKGPPPSISPESVEGAALAAASSAVASVAGNNNLGFNGTYHLVKSDNFDEYMKAIGVGYMLRKMAASAKPVTEVKTEGDTWIITTKTSFKTTELKFKLGQEFDEETGDGRKCKSIVALMGNTLVHTQKCGGPPLRITREFKGNEMKMVMEAPGGVKATRVYNKE